MQFQNVCLSVLISAFLVSCGGSRLDQQLAGNIELEENSYEVYLVGSDSLATTGFFNYKRIELRENKNADPFLVIDSLDHTSWDTYAEFDDRNFDGYPDIAILLEDPAYKWNPFSLWLYDPEKKIFVYNNFMEYLPHSTYWLEEKKLIQVSSFDHAETHTDSYFAFENGDFVKVKEEITTDGSFSSRLSVRIVTERVNGKMKVTSKTSTAGSLELKKSGSITDKDEIRSFLELFGDGAGFQPILRKGSTFKKYHDTCVTAGFSLELDADEEWEDHVGRFFPIVDWEELYEGPDEMSTIEQINYRSNGNSFTLFLKYIEEVYEEDSEPSYNLNEETETLAAIYSKDISSWVFDPSYDDIHYMPADQAEDLPMDENECEGYGEDY